MVPNWFGANEMMIKMILKYINMLALKNIDIATK